MSALEYATPEVAQSNEIRGAVTGTLVGFGSAGETPLVIYPGQPGTAALQSQTTVDLNGAHLGRAVVLLFENGDPRRPVIIGCLRDGGKTQSDVPPPTRLDVDGDRLVVVAQEQLVLRCGQASITLTRAGKVLIEGAYVSTRSTGVNRIKGGSIQLN